MTGAVDQKTYWGLGELVMWIRTRNHEWVAALSDMSEEEAMRVAMFAFKARLDRTPLPSLLVANSDADREGPRRKAMGNRRTSTGLSRCHPTKPSMTCIGKCAAVASK